MYVILGPLSQSHRHGAENDVLYLFFFWKCYDFVHVLLFPVALTLVALIVAVLRLFLSLLLLLLLVTARYPGDPLGQAFVAGVKDEWVVKSAAWR